MNLLRPELLDRLASEYVLGTLRLGARRRFDRLLRDSPAAREAVLYWQQRLLPLAEQSGVLMPPETVWHSIEQRLFGVAPGTRPAAAPDGNASWWHRLGLWQGAALASSLCAIWLGSQLLRVPTATPPEPIASTAFVVALNNTAGQQSVLVSVQKAAPNSPANLVISMVAPPPLQSTQDLQLWSIPKQAGMPPRSLGVLPRQGSLRLALSDESLIESAAALAVSVEPTGGSTTGLPTGPVVLQGKPLKL
jgi:anti-sigma-K factor RskA